MVALIGETVSMVEFTERERQVHELTADGLSVKAICERLGIKSGTVKTHRKNARLKIKHRADEERARERAAELAAGFDPLGVEE